MTTIEKIGTRYVLTFTIAVFAGKVVNETATEVHATRKAAERSLAKWDRINAENLAWLADVRAARLAAANDYLANRAARAPLAQLSMF